MKKSKQQTKARKGKGKNKYSKYSKVDKIEQEIKWRNEM